MTKEEKDTVDTDTSQTDTLVDSQTPVHHEGSQNLSTVNLPQPSVLSEAGSSQAYSGGHVNVIEKENEDLIEELPIQSSSEVDRCSTESKPHSTDKSHKISTSEIKKFVLSGFDRLINDLFRAITSSFVAILSATCGVYVDSGKYLDLGLSVCVVCATFFVLSFCKRGRYYSVVTEYMDKVCPGIAAGCIDRQEIPRRSSQFYHGIETDTNFEHEVADTSGEVPRMVFRNEESDFSHSTDRPESPKVVNVDVYCNMEEPDYSEGACGYTPTEGGACGYTPTEDGACGYTPTEVGACGYTPTDCGGEGQSCR